MNNRHIVITGFMGCGKSSVAKALAELRHCKAIDVDKAITQSEGRTPAEIIHEDGEAAFRRIETRILREVLGNKGSCVISLGGGAWTIPNNRELIAQYDCLSIWLDAPFDVCWTRITAAGGNRPLARKEQQAKDLYDQRRPLYELATLRFEIRETSRPEETAQRLDAALSLLS